MKKRSARGTMTRESVAEAALAIADRHGFEAVTIRAVAVAVGATPMALYTYFRDKDALYGGMRERIFANVIVSIRSGGKWQTMLETCGQAVFRVMREHPNWTPPAWMFLRFSISLLWITSDSALIANSKRA